MQSIDPKNASVKGGTPMELLINIDPLTFQYLKHLSVGFQKKKKEEHSDKKPGHDNTTINPLDLSTNDPDLEKENFICVEGEYKDGKITCVVPMLQEF